MEGPESNLGGEALNLEEVALPRGRGKDFVSLSVPHNGYQKLRVLTVSPAIPPGDPEWELFWCYLLGDPDL